MNAPAEVEQIEAAAVMPLPSPGALLKLARERAGVGVDDLASQLKLARGTVEALERDDFGALSEPVYVRGYYRKIAKALGTPEKELIDAYLALHPAQAATVRPAPLPLAGGVDAGISRRAQGQGMLVLGGIVAVSVVLMVLMSEPPRTARLSKSAPEVITAPEPAVVEASEEAGAIIPTEQPAPINKPVEPVATGPALTQPAASAAAATPSPSPAASAPSTPPPTAAAPAAAPAATTRTPTVAATAGATQLVLNFSESSFARIEDSRGRTLLIGLVRGGEQPVLDGQPPYTVFLGNAKNVKIFRDGKAVDFSADINAQNDTARFTVP